MKFDRLGTSSSNRQGEDVLGLGGIVPEGLDEKKVREHIRDQAKLTVEQ